MRTTTKPLDKAHEMLSKLSPTRFIPAALPESPTLSSRWSRWQPWCLIEARRQVDPQQVLGELRARHSAYFTALVRANVSIPVIKRHELDDPRVDAEHFRKRLADAMERSRMHPNQHSRKTNQEYTRRSKEPSK